MKGDAMRIGMMGMAVMLTVASTGMAHGELENGKPWSVPKYLLIAKAPQVASTSKERTMAICHVIDYRFPTEPDGSYWGESNGGLSPQYLAQDYFRRYLNRTDVGTPSLAAVEVLLQPKHGYVKPGKNAGDVPLMLYIPELNYIGTDKVVFGVMTDAGPVVVQYYLVVTNKGSESKAAERLCDKASNHPNSTSGWKISSSFTTPAFDNATLQALLDATGINNSVTVNTARENRVDKRGQTTVSHLIVAYRHG